MNPEKVIFGFFIILSLTTNFGFFIGDISNPDFHDEWHLFVTLVVNAIATVLKFGDRSHLGATMLATSLAAMLQLVAASVVWAIALYGTGTGLTTSIAVSIVSLSGGAMIANLVSVVLLIVETVMLKR